MSALSRSIAIVFVCVLVVAVASPALAGPPTEALRGYVDRLFTVMDDPRLKEPGRSADRHRTVRALAEEALDFNESARRSLAAHWDARTPAERARFARLFTDLIDHAYLSRLSLDGEKIALDSETITDTKAVVKGRALTKNGTTPVQFHLHRDATGRWRLYDVSFEGMSLVGTYRAQFNKIIRTSSFEELVTRLEEKTRTDAQASTGAEPARTP